MNKKITIIFSFLLVTIFGLTACGTQKQIVKKENNASEFRRPDFGQPERNPDVVGLVKSVVGNKVTILKIDRPTDEEREARRAEMQKSESTKTSPSIGGASTGMRGMGMGSRSNSDRTEAEMLEIMKDRSTGEEVVTIPVGIRMLKTEISEERKGEPIMSEGTLEDVQKDKMISIWLNKDITDRNIADFVLFR